MVSVHAFGPMQLCSTGVLYGKGTARQSCGMSQLLGSNVWELWCSRCVVLPLLVVAVGVGSAVMLWRGSRTLSYGYTYGGVDAAAESGAAGVQVSGRANNRRTAHSLTPAMPWVSNCRQSIDRCG
jgi:hypothetical protein